LFDSGQALAATLHLLWACTSVFPWRTSIGHGWPGQAGSNALQFKVTFKGRVMRFVLPLILVLGSVGTNAFADAPVVHTQNGDVLGALQGSVESFKALPYAAPPVGDLRWKPPQDPSNWLGVRDGSKFSAACPQQLKDPISGTLSLVGSEDCLYLNVYRPQGAQGLPVILFIHGGHNVTGSAGDAANGVAIYDGSEPAQNGNVVVVTINYRLAALGFVSHPALSTESGYGASGNYGYMDQIRALKWVSHNIAAFGGDPNNITLFGQSAGGGGVLVLMVSPLSQGLFHRAIIHSGQFRTNDLKTAENLGASLPQKLNCQGAANLLQCMRNRSANDVVLAMPGGHPGGGSVSGPTLFLPVVDRRILPDLPLKVIRSGDYNHVPVLVGSVMEETSWIYEKDSMGINTEEDYHNTVTSDYATATTASQLLGLYPSGDYPSPRDGYSAPSPRQAFNAISADHWFLCPAQRLVQALSVHQPEFVGRFFHTHVLSGYYGMTYGASHGFDLLFLFGTFGYYQMTPTLDELTLKDNYQKIWMEFVRSGGPGNLWDRYDAARDNYAILNIPMSSGTHLRTKQCDYWYPLDKPPPEVGTGKPIVVNERALPPPELPFRGDR
jgi:para-nitrobenzyl esterase